MNGRTLFGTDGIRGKANQHPMTADVATQVAMAAGSYLRQRNLKNGTGSHRHPKALIGKDTRLSGYLLEPALTAGFIAVGMDVVLLGPMPTPAVAMLTHSLRADLGVMISASHNHYEDNGIKLFGADGFKLSDAAERDIESLITQGVDALRVEPAALGRAARLDDAAGRYIEFSKATFPSNLTLAGKKIVLDCAHGAAYKVAPAVLWELGADVIELGVEPNGININDGVGATHPQALTAAVREHGADIGIALDGDADRLMLVDEKGDVIDGDQILAIIATELHSTGKLKKPEVVGTVMSNLGLELYLNEHGMSLHRAQVGDRYVIEMMQAKGINLGGEQSGHIILRDYTTTGDGLIAALEVLAALQKSGKKASALSRLFTPVPQILKSIQYEKGSADPCVSEPVQQAVAKASRQLGTTGRVVLRKSGTEPVIRVMVEGQNLSMVEQVVDDLSDSIQQQVRQSS